MSELLLVIVDCTRSAWAAVESEGRASSAAGASERRVAFPEFAAALQLFLAAFVGSCRGNRIALLGFNGEEGGYILRPPPAATGGVADHMRPATIQRALEGGLWPLRYGAGGWRPADDGDGDPPLPPFERRFSSLTACVTLAMCYCSKVGGRVAAGGGIAAPPPTLAPSSSSSRTRILVFQVAPDAPAQYVAFNNALFAAVHREVLLDSLVLCRTPSVFLQQGAQLTGGLHLHPPPSSHGGLAQVLLSLLLPTSDLRSHLLQPPQHGVNLRSHCFCHKRLTSLAWLCITCLSVWCEHASVCATCGEGGATGGDVHAA